MSSIEDAIVDLIEKNGPRTGSEIQKETGADSLLLWKTCKTSGRIEVRTVGKRYMRLDRHVDRFARLSPSILREFFTYSVVGRAGDRAGLDARCAALETRILEISRMKFELARRMVSEVMDEYEDASRWADRVCFILAGDIVYNMAHDVPRPERSTGRLVRGSDMDLVVVVDDDVPDACMEALDGLIYRKKYRMLIDPAVNEEVDYKIKRLGRVREQATFDDFKRMVAVKILDEGVLLYGSEKVFGDVKKILEEKDLPHRLHDLEVLAHYSRLAAEASILNDNLDVGTIRKMHLFYSAEEFEEFE